MEWVPEKVYVPNVLAISIFFLLHEYWLNYRSILCLLNQLEWVDSSWCDLDQLELSQNLCDSKLQKHQRPKFSTSELFLRSACSIFKVASKVFTLNFCCVLTKPSPVEDIWRLTDQVEDVLVDLYCILWYRGHNGSLWVHPYVFINIPPGSRNISNTIKIPMGGLVLISLSWSNRLVEVEDSWYNCGVCLIRCVILERIKKSTKYLQTLLF